MSGLKPKTKIYYGWVQVIACWLIYFLVTTPTSYGVTATLIPNMAVSYGWNTSMVSFCSSALSGSIAVFSTVYGIIAPKCRMKTIMAGAAVCGITGVLLTVLFGKVPFLVAFACVMLGICSAMTALIPTTIIINNWFHRNRSMPMAVLMTSGGVGGFVMPLIYQHVFHAFGSAGCFMISILALAFTLLIVIFVIKKEPSEIGEVPDGIEWNKNHPAGMAECAADKEKSSPADSGITVWDLLKTAKFYIIAGTQFANRFTMTAVCCYIVLYSYERGLTDAAIFVSVFNLVGFAGRLSAGAKDKLPFSTKTLNSTSLFFMFAGTLIMTLGASKAVLMAGIVIAGYGVGFHLSFTPLLVSDYFDDKSYTLAYSVLYTVACASAFVYPFMIVALYAVTGSYSCAFLLSTVVDGLCLLLSFALKN